MASIQLNGGLNNDQAKSTGGATGTTTTSITTTSTSSSTTTTTTLSTITTTTHSVVGGSGSGPSGAGTGSGIIAPMDTLAEVEAQPATTTGNAGEDREEEGYSLLTYPKDKSCFAQFTWLIIWPIHLLFRIAIPDCKKAKNNKIFPLTFIMCIVWIGSLSYVVAWMITIIGKDIGL